MQQKDTIRLQKLFHFCKIFFIMSDTDMLKHTDRNNPVKLLVQRSVILKQEAAVFFSSGLGSSPVGNRMLFMRKGDARDIYS